MLLLEFNHIFKKSLISLVAQFNIPKLTKALLGKAY